MHLGFSNHFPFIHSEKNKRGASSPPPLVRQQGQYHIKEIEKTRAEEAKSRQKLDKQLQQYEHDYVQKHNQLASAIESRNNAEGNLITEAIQVGTSDSAERVGLSIAQNNSAVRVAIENQAAQYGIAPEFVKSAMRGAADTKAEQQGLTPKQYDQPTKGNYLSTGVKALEMTPDVAKTAHRHTSVLKFHNPFKKAKANLQEARTAQLIQDHGSHLVYKNGRIVSGSYQASSPEELAGKLKQTEPASNIKPSDVELPIPNATHLLPPAAPEKLPVAPNVKARQKEEQAVKNLSPKEKTERELAQRDQEMANAKAELLKQDPVALQGIIQNRDTSQVETCFDGVRAVMHEPKAAMVVAVDHLGKYIGTDPGIKPETLAQANNRFGYALGKEVGNGNVEQMIQEQSQVEALHSKGKKPAQILFGHSKEKAMEKDLDMIIDEETGEKFYDTYDTARNMRAANRRYEKEAKEALPRPEDAIYLNDEVTHFVPGVMEGINRFSNYWNAGQ